MSWAAFFAMDFTFPGREYWPPFTFNQELTACMTSSFILFFFALPVIGLARIQRRLFDEIERHHYETRHI